MSWCYWYPHIPSCTHIPWYHDCFVSRTRLCHDLSLGIPAAERLRILSRMVGYKNLVLPCLERASHFAHNVGMDRTTHQNAPRAFETAEILSILELPVDWQPKVSWPSKNRSPFIKCQFRNSPMFAAQILASVVLRKRSHFMCRWDPNRRTIPNYYINQLYHRHSLK